MFEYNEKTEFLRFNKLFKAIKKNYKIFLSFLKGIKEISFV